MALCEHDIESADMTSSCDNCRVRAGILAVGSHAVMRAAFLEQFKWAFALPPADAERAADEAMKDAPLVAASKRVSIGLVEIATRYGFKIPSG